MRMTVLKDRFTVLVEDGGQRPKRAEGGVSARA